MRYNKLGSTGLFVLEFCLGDVGQAGADTDWGGASEQIFGQPAV